MIQDREIMRAVSRILQRSERQLDSDKLIASFVDVGLVSQLNNPNNQIFYGRRGTGKTHVLKVLESQLNNESDNVVIYVDARTLGSTAQFSDDTIPIKNRCLALFRDILSILHDSLLERIINKPSKRADSSLEALERLSASITEPFTKYHEDSLKKIATHKEGKTSGVGIGLDSSGVFKVDAKKTTARNDESTTETSIIVKYEDKVVFPAIHETLKQILDNEGIYLYVLLDEWASLPRELQPFLAEFFKRSILPISRAVLKIASLEYRSFFSVVEKMPVIGFELGADISTAPDLDDYYVYDRNPEQLINIYSDILLRHLIIDLPTNYLRDSYGIKTGDELASKMFTERATFKELARACEGVTRDLINIFTLAFFHSQRRGRESIDKKSIIEAARQWFEQDKAQPLDESMQIVLRRIIDEIIGKKRARSFLIQRELEKHPIIQKLFDARVIHQMQRGYADKDNPGVRYNIYSLDYGTYVDLIGTSKQPFLDLEEQVTEDVVVPYDDKRSIRRVILKGEILN